MTALASHCIDVLTVPILSGVEAQCNNMNLPNILAHTHITLRCPPCNNEDVELDVFFILVFLC